MSGAPLKLQILCRVARVLELCATAFVCGEVIFKVIFMTRTFFRFLPAVLGMALLMATPAHAALGRATADFDNARPNKGETAFGRLVADSLRGATGADLALINAGALKAGSLKSGAVEQAQIDALLAFGDDDVVTVTISGTQLRAALENAVREYPTGDVAFLHGAGLSVTFSGQGGPPRILSLRVNGRDVNPGDNFRVAMPVSLANGADGYFKFWNGQNAPRAGVKVRQAVANFIAQRREVSPDTNPRIAPR